MLVFDHILIKIFYFTDPFFRPTSRTQAPGNGSGNATANQMQVGIADDQAKDFDFEKTEMKYDSTGMVNAGNLKNAFTYLIFKCRNKK